MALTDFIFVFVVAALFMFSSIKDRARTKKALQVSKNVLVKQLPIFLAVFFLVGIFEAFLTPEVVRTLLGSSAGFLATIAGTVIGGIATGPPAAAFPIAEYLWKAGASHAAVAAFVVAWVSVGTVTLPMEIATYGRRFAVTRWGFSVLTSIVIGLTIGVVL